MELYTLKNEHDLKNVRDLYQDCYFFEECNPTEYPCCIIVNIQSNVNGSKDMCYTKFVYKSDFN